mgnify:CR=1 FL=1
MDFIIIDNRKEDFNFKPEELCCRGKSIGADGLILIKGTSLNLFKAPSPRSEETDVIFSKKTFP